MCSEWPWGEPAAREERREEEDAMHYVVKHNNTLVREPCAPGIAGSCESGERAHTVEVWDADQ